ncbi:ATP-binding cassette domain-containing protein [Aestuariicella hydrocarbonica]|uniref:ATP-binding cassette domain-containing protein n=1 Tax=Pseudomaricurvus hydrocarbonicus TaxID=1470433 RepID=A0A9E5MNJ0_9GAMM|nr:oligopeptide/dipeptide ABC transporter ATP-binding protein [Aestuariicella hydrocarbonica]NHO67554.1 ATP-binding cassette domain-containing protein [Aestuariicella hydrocarbonica]
MQIKNLSKHFQLGGGEILTAVDEVSLDIAENAIVGLVGESGSGKSTLGKTLVGLHEKSGGQVLYRGQPLPQRYSTADYRRMSKDIQMIFQDPYASLNPRMTIEEILTEPLRLQQRKLSSEKRRQLAASWLERVSLNASYLGRYPHEFSGGQRQRIGIARALITEPTFVVCDEPISALDVSVQAQVVNLLGDLQQSLGLTLLFIAHDLSMVRYISDTMVVMYLGSVVEQGPSDEVFFSPKHPYTQALTKSNPLADPQQEKARAHDLIVGEMPSPVNLPAGCRFAGRCDRVMDRCHRERPPLQLIATDRWVACHLY